MALAKRCDRCGKFYEYYITTDKVNAVGLFKISQNGNIWAPDKSGYDLCPECLREFEDFMKGE